MKRREFITLLGGAVAWPGVVRAQPADRTRRIGMLQTLAADDREAQSRNTAFVEGLQQLGWTDGRNILIEMRWASEIPSAFVDTRLNWLHSRRT